MGTEDIEEGRRDFDADPFRRGLGEEVDFVDGGFVGLAEPDEEEETGGDGEIFKLGFGFGGGGGEFEAGDPFLL